MNFLSTSISNLHCLPLYQFQTNFIYKSMASSSSASHSVPASMSQSWSYDVFLSFRGEDTRKGFVGHLYTALQHKGIYTYKDDETLARGESIGPTLLKAIEDSRIAVVVFSKNYADSSWCLAELAHIIECVDKRGQILMPIFYHVDPSDVRKLKRKYEEAFSKHVTENKEKVETWRKALEKAGNISGWTINDTINCYEAKCIKEIVDTISNKLPTVSANVNKNLVGMEARLRDLKSKLKIGSDGVRIVGIWGLEVVVRLLLHLLLMPNSLTYLKLTAFFKISVRNQTSMV
ncbi:putative TIR domain-containing protein [Helianthus annuus]|nr:putative TIR domain-containing protein [Helianthus annuus]